MPAKYQSWFRVVMLLVAGLTARGVAAWGRQASQPPAHTLNDPTRPIYHLVSQAKGSHIADPNFAFYWKGRYHLFYISARWRPGARRNFAHVSSTDMVHWQHHPETNFGGLSGTMFLSNEGVPTIIARPGAKITMLAPMDDRLETWKEVATVEPTFTAGQDGSRLCEKHWDPDAWVVGDTTYVLMGAHPLDPESQVGLLKTTDMKTFQFVDYFLEQDLPGVSRTADVTTNDDLSCPNLFPLGKKWMLLCISHNRGCRYYLGDWKHEKFTPDFHGWMNWHKGEVVSTHGHGGDVFAPETLLTPDGRRVMWAWLFAQSKLRVSPNWQEVISLPRELSLPDDGVLRIKPLQELAQLREKPKSAQAITVSPGSPVLLQGISGDTMELMVAIKPGTATRCGVKVLCDNNHTGGLDVVVDPGGKRLQVGSAVAPLELGDAEDIQLRIFIDRSVIEVFANDRQAVVWQHPYKPGELGVCLFSEGGVMEVSEVTSWQMKAASPPLSNAPGSLTGDEG